MFDNYAIQDLLTFTEADIKDLGVKNSAHRARVVSSLVALRTKQGKGRLQHPVDLTLRDITRYQMTSVSLLPQILASTMLLLSVEH
jgi:hypothetical protein